MNYVSTRGAAPRLTFSDVLLAGLASDGGLYVPETWPTVSREEIAGFAGRPYAEVAAAIVGRFVGDDIAPADLRRFCDEAYGSFTHPAVAPLVQIGPGAFVLELFHGPTLAFKDVAMQLLARLMDHVLGQRAMRATVVAATSGDTGGAAVEAFRGHRTIDVFILFPEGRVTPVQQRQMTTSGDPNVHALAVKGSFDDCQGIVKALFARSEFRKQVSLTGVNSINWARIVAQIVYYFTAASALGAPLRKVAFTVPTGNFGDVFAGYVAMRMGLPIDKLVVATNSNDVVARAINTGRVEVHSVVPTLSPAMDIQVSSNFERLLFDASGRDSEAVKRQMAGLAQSGSFTIDAPTLRAVQAAFVAARTDEAATLATMRDTFKDAGYLADPHTAVGLAAAKIHARPGVPMVTLSTAHPAKFPDAVQAATGITPTLPAHLAGLMERTERVTTLGNDIGAVESYIAAHSRALRQAA
ncbi:MAG: threonine synthase [Bauldia sp.]|nr:threonine synthase [Bauldia sp.]